SFSARNPLNDVIFFSFCEDGCCRKLLVPSLGCGVDLFFCLGCFLVAVGMGRVRWALENYVGMGMGVHVGNFSFVGAKLLLASPTLEKACAHFEGV
ncbi:MAG TPA: hypothetical protein VLL96_03080, partial [Candidatus Deferrimicrobiaceae bacterium]|nr:hypothetical protein [Candidatus Deferrimicrobiaceae bacterium]